MGSHAPAICALVCTVAPGARYFDNVVAGAKLHLADQTADLPSLAVTTSISVPTASQRGYVRSYDAAVVAHASKDLGRLHLDLNAGLVVDQLGGPRADQPWLALAATYALTWDQRAVTAILGVSWAPIRLWGDPS